MNDVRDALHSWLANQDERLDRFRRPISLSEVADESGVSQARLATFLRAGGEPVYHSWKHTHAGKSSRSKPYSLRLNGPGTVGLDWEHSVVGAAEAAFQRQGYETCRELGTDEHLEHLLVSPALGNLVPGSNQRDLWALRRVGSQIDLWIIEAKGKEAYGFDHYCFAETLGQLFEVSGEWLTALLGAQKGDGHGLCWRIARRLHQAWSQQGLAPTITLAVLVPHWAPDVVWDNGRPRTVPEGYYSRPVAACRQYLRTGDSAAVAGRHKYQRAFGAILEELDEKVGLRALARATAGLRFRLLGAQCHERGEFQLTDLTE